jgi:hypothetical protein
MCAYNEMIIVSPIPCSSSRVGVCDGALGMLMGPTGGAGLLKYDPVQKKRKAIRQI